MTNLSWQEALASETDVAKKELMALHRRYRLQLSSIQPTYTVDQCICLLFSLSDPEVPTRLKGQVELTMILPQNYPSEAVRVNFTQWNSRLSETQVNALNAAVATRAQQLCGSYSLRKLLTWIDNNCWRIIAPFELEAAVNLDVMRGSQEKTHEMQKSMVAAEVPAQSGKKSKRNRGQRACHFFARGDCRNGRECKYMHEMKQGQEKGDGVSADSGMAKIPAAVSAETLRPLVVLPELKKNEKKTRVRTCKFFARNKCRDEDNCKFSHEIEEAGTQNNSQKRTFESSPCVEHFGTLTESEAGLKNDQPVAEAEKDSVGCNVESIETRNDTSNVWSEAQQRALDMALKKYPLSMDKKERWNSIANAVDGRSLNECIDRYKTLREVVRRGVDPIALIEKAKGHEETAPSSESKVCGQNVKIIPAEQRVPIMTETKIKGTPVCLEDLFLHKIGTLVAHRLVCQLLCDNCPLKFDAILSLDSADIQKWCPRCSVLHHVLMKPVFAHSLSNVLAYVDTENCCVIDILPTDVLATCLECGCEALLEKIMPQQRSEQACFSCHVKLALMAKCFVARQSKGSTSKQNLCSDAAGKVANIRKKESKPVANVFVLGQLLPRNGTCDHYKHSQRWFRFQCCGKAFPCDVCHDSSECSQANLGKFASRMICGLCSKEQSSSVKACSCGNDFVTKKSASRHWEGGAGCRDSLHMSRLDKQKHRGQNKTESRKFNRVGAEAKKRRENGIERERRKQLYHCRKLGMENK